MVGPIYIIAIALGTAFSLGLFKNANRNISFALMFLAMAFMTFISGQWLYAFLTQQQETIQIFTAGFKPPFSISLQLGLHEAIFISIVNVVGLLSALYLIDHLRNKGVNMMMIFILLFMGLNVVVMTRDIFNLFVFLEISSIAIIGLIILEKSENAISSGFKYLIASGIISGLLLIGIIAVYYYSGSLYINDIIESNLLAVKGGSVAAFLILIAIILELKPFPANGWALDVYESAHPAVGAIVSAASATAGIFILNKLLPVFNESAYYIISIIGILTFLGSNLIGIKQNKATRLLGYSSIGQIGLVMLVMGLAPYLGEKTPFIAFGILISNVLAKAGLFWLAGIVKAENIRDWSVIRRNPHLLVLMGTFIFALVGFPPFPSFFAKWELIMELANNQGVVWIAFILLGSFIEGIYLFRWFGYAIKAENQDLPEFKIQWNKIIPVIIFAIGLYGLGYYYSIQMGSAGVFNYIPLLFILFLYAIDFLPVYIKNTISIVGIGYYLYTILPGLEEFKLYFGLIFLAGGIITLLAGYTFKGKRQGFYPLVMMMFAGLLGLIEANTMLEFFFAWELMTVGSYFLIIRGKKSMPHALSYILFSVGGAYLILAGFGLAHIGQSSYSLDILSNVQMYAPIIFSLLAVGFMTKTASIGLHIWLPGAHAEAESDVSPMVSAILLKAGVFGLIILMLNMGAQSFGSFDIYYALAWIGAITAVMGNMMAAFQEDAKRLLAYSSIGFLGYAVFGLSLMSHLGWLAAVSLSVIHFMFKTLLFLAIGGVVMRVKTKEMYKMGGLIKKMPFTFISVLIGIIVISGVPPLTGFGGKWILYNAVLDKGWFFPAAVVFFAGIIAFLYCFRLIHTVFLGQLKDEHREVKEAPFWMLLPQYIILAVIMLFSALPNSLLKPIGEMLMPYFPDGALEWHGQLALSAYGYWDGKMIMYIVGGIFVTVFAWLWYMNRNAQSVKQFNIGYSGERPSRPETTHFAYNFFAPYKKALGFLVAPVISDFWDSVSDGIHAIADKIRRIYDGNAQNYALHIIMFVVVFYLIAFGG
jgi:formate hydrogenlyase subunit 3/multisubunit Na+/H+ antiporter MnhD subunit